MEFKAVVDVKARDPRAAPWLASTRAASSASPPGSIDAQIGGLIGQSARARRFCRQSGRHPAVAAAAGRCIRPGAARGSRFAQRLSAANNIARPCSRALKRSSKPVRATRWCTWRSKRSRTLEALYRARMVAEIFLRADLQDSRPEVRCETKTAQTREVSVAAENARAAKAVADGLKIGAAIGGGLALSRDLANLPPNICTPTYSGQRAQGLAKEWPRIKTKVLDENGIKALKMGAFLAVTQGSAQPPRLDRLRVSRQPRKARADLPGRQGNHLRFGRNIAQRSAGHGRNEIRHERRGRRARRIAHGRRACAAHQRRGHRRGCRKSCRAAVR